MYQIKIRDIVSYHIKKEFNLLIWPQVKATQSVEPRGNLELSHQLENLLSNVIGIMEK